MARVTMLCLLLLTTSLHHVTSFAVHRRNSRSTDLADALRMLERQRRRIDSEESLLPPQLLGERPITLEDLNSWFEPGANSQSDEGMSEAWLDGYNGLQDLQEDPQSEGLLREPPQAPPVEMAPSDQELDAIFGEKENEDGEDKRSPPDAQKKDKEVMTEITGDVTPKVKTRSSDDAIVSETSDSTDDVRLTREEFKALLKAVEKLQKQALDKATEAAEEAEEVAEEVEEKVAEAREEAKEAEEEAQEEEILTPKPQPVSNEELDNLFEEESEEVIPTENGEIVKTEKTVEDSEGRPVGQEETVEQVETIPDKATLSSIENFWYLKNYLDQEGDRKKRNSKRNPIPPSLAGGLSPPDVISSPDSADLIEAYVNRINQLQSQLDQAKLVAYLEDVENDILTDALNEATLAQVKGHINPAELSSLQDAIQVEEALQQVKANRLQAADLADELADEIADEFAASDTEKRGEPWRKRNDVMQSEVPVYITGDSDDATEDDGDDSEEETTALALGKWLDKNEQKIDLDDVFQTSPEELGFGAGRMDDDLIRESDSSGIASLFSNKADQCPAVQKFSTNCHFAGDSIDFEARALCNVHEMCYVCGRTFEIQKDQCDFIYRAAATMLCQEDEECVLEAEVFLNTMKLKHRFNSKPLDVCRRRCTAEFLSMV